MATDKTYIDFVCEQLPSSRPFRYKKMFGEYMIYIDEKPIFTVCDNTLFVKILPEAKDLMSGCAVGTPYPGAKECYIVDVEDRDFLEKTIDLYVTLIKPRKK